jgi:hypothetical protein
MYVCLSLYFLLMHLCIYEVMNPRDYAGMHVCKYVCMYAVMINKRQVMCIHAYMHPVQKCQKLYTYTYIHAHAHIPSGPSVPMARTFHHRRPGIDTMHTYIHTCMHMHTCTALHLLVHLSRWHIPFTTEGQTLIPCIHTYIHIQAHIYSPSALGPSVPMARTLHYRVLLAYRYAATSLIALQQRSVAT